MQTKATIILLGGALMVTQIGNRKSTQDIDVVIATNDRRTYQTIQQAIQLVAKEKKLSSSWMNDDVTIIIDQIGKPKSPRHWKTFSSLTVYIPELEYILALKLFRDGLKTTATSRHSPSGFTFTQRHKPGRL